MKRLTLTLVIGSFVGLLCTALAQTNRLPVHGSWLVQARVPGGSLSKPAAPMNPTATIYHVVLNNAQVSRIANDRLVITMRTSGDLPGVLTLKVDMDGPSQIFVSGEWALVVSFIQDIPTSEPKPAGRSKGSADDDGGGEILVQKGVVKGTISGGSVTLNSDGIVASINSVQLNINGGTASYESVIGGIGTAQGTDLQDFATSAGTLDLNF